jgi:glycosyltransferase involved in cell wall biosynthesis
MRVAVLLSTYNGERWLGEQLDSIFGQTVADVVVKVRDDGSSDGTLDVLGHYEARHPQLQHARGPNLGAAQSFLTLLRGGDGSEAYAAFCDQDDVWEPDHLERALAALATAGEGPALWCSNVLVCDEQLRPLRRLDIVRRGPSFANALVENVASGTTIVLNRAAADLVAAGPPEHPVMHDAWAYLVVSALGTVLYDPRPSVRYRLHADNTMGLSAGRAATALARVRRASAGPHVAAWTRQAADLSRLHGSRLPPAAARELERFLAGRESLRPRLAYAATGKAHRQRRLETAAVRLAYVARRI